MPQKYFAQKNKKRSFWFFLRSFFVLVFLLGGLLLFAFYLKTNQDNRQQASENTNKIVISLQASSPDNNHLKIDVMANTQGYRFAAIDVQGTVAETTSDNVKIENVDSLSLNLVKSNLSQDNQTTHFRVVKLAQPDPNAQTSSHGENTKLFSVIVTNPKNKKATISIDSSASDFSFIGSQPSELQFPAAQTFLLRIRVPAVKKTATASGTTTPPVIQNTASSAAVLPSSTPLLADAVVIAIDGVPVSTAGADQSFPSPSPIFFPSPSPLPTVTPSPVIQPAQQQTQSRSEEH